MSEKNEVSARNETPAMYKSELSDLLNLRLDEAHRLAQNQFQDGQRSGGFGAVGSYFFTIFFPERYER
jgi:hypothetical protein